MNFPPKIVQKLKRNATHVRHCIRLSGVTTSLDFKAMKPGVTSVVVIGVAFMKKLSLGMAAMLALLSIAGCAQYEMGKGKAPPPVITKG